MGDFALVTEGVTDHTILKNVLIGYFKNQESYDVASKGYKKRATLIADGSKNPSLAFFIESLNQQNIVLEDTN